jgi:hypothetical protein
MHRLLGALVLALSMLCAERATAQAAPDVTPPDSPSHNVFVARTVTSFIGWFPGAVIGGVIGTRVPRGPCYCDDPGLKQAVIGIAIGGAIGAAVGAAVPKLNSPCSFKRRFGLGLLGSAVGAGVGMIEYTEGSRAVTVPLFSIIGASVAEVRC